MRLNDALVGAVLVLFAVAVWAYSGTFPETHGQAYGPALFPRIIAVGLAVCGLILCAGGVRDLPTQGWVSLGDWAGNRRRVVNVLLIPGGLLFYIALAEPIGFMPVAFVLLLILLWRNDVRLWVSLLVAGVSTAFIHTLFYGFLHVPLPWGLLEEYAW